MEEGKNENEVKLFPGVNKELFEKISSVVNDYPIKDVVMTLWYVLIVFNMAMFSKVEEK